MSPHKGYMNIAIATMLFVAAFAGVAFIADEDVAAEGEGQSQAQEYTVTYSYNGSVVSEKINKEYKVKSLETVMPTAKAPEAREFAYWVSGSAIFKENDALSVAGDITLTPSFQADRAIVKLVYDDIEMEFFGESAKSTSYTISEKDLENFAKRIGAAIVKNEGDAITGLAIDGFKFTGFKADVSKEEVVTLNKLTASEIGVSAYTAVFAPIYKVSFIADDVVISTQTTDKIISIPVEKPSKAHYDFAGWFDKDGNAFKADTEYTSDVIYIAKFTPLTYKVYFMNGEAIVAERSSEYLGQIDLPALPENCTAWADKDGKIVGSPVTITGPDMRFYAVAEVVKCNVTFIAGEQTVATVEVVKGEKLAVEQIPALPEGAEKWDFDFEAPISEDVVIKSVAKVYDVTFDFGIMYAAMNVTIQVEHGQVIPADKVPAIPAEFPEKNKRWAYDADAPVVKDMTVTLRDNIYYTVTFIAGEQTVDTVSVLEKTVVAAPELPEGYKAWDFDFTAVITADTTIRAIAKENVFDVTFEIEGKTPVVQKSDSLVIPDPNVTDKVFKGWVVKGQTQYVDPSTYAIKEDVTFVAIYDEAPAPAGPGFFETNEGKCVAVIIGVALLAFVYAVYTNMFGMKDFLTSIKIQRVKKE